MRSLKELREVLDLEKIKQLDQIQATLNNFMRNMFLGAKIEKTEKISQRKISNRFLDLTKVLKNQNLNPRTENSPKEQEDKPINKMMKNKYLQLILSKIGPMKFMINLMLIMMVMFL